MSRIAFLFAALMALGSWLVPNHYPPWVSFHAEALMILAGVLALSADVLAHYRQVTQLTPLTLLALAVACVPPVQWAAGLIHFAGDAWMASAYLLAFALALILGQRLAARSGLPALLERLALLFLAASMLSVALQLYQWLRLSGLGIFAADLPPNGRPFANVGQPNHLATMLYLGLVGTLYLFERERLRAGVAAAACAFLGLGMTMTSSRTAWVSLSILLLWLFAVRQRAALRISRVALVGIAAGFIALLLSWAPLSDVLLLSSGRTIGAQLTQDSRPLLWSTMADAVLQQPWTGYGWNQGLVGHGRVVDMHPAGGRLFDSSHNIVLDLMVWNGIPVALVLVAAVAAWLIARMSSARESASAYALAAIFGVVAHAMVEFPLSYAYFLIPVGILMGALQFNRDQRWEVRLPSKLLASLAVAGVVLTGAVVVEYAEVESNMRVLRFETARIGTHEITSEAPDLILLTQWREYLRFARAQARAGMSDDELAWMSKVAERFPYASGLLELAVARGLNGRPAQAAEALRRLCGLHTVRRCREHLVEWKRLARAHPELSQVALPAPH